MKAKLICYTIKQKGHKARSKLKRELFGYTDKSNNGKYEYERKGLLQKIPNLKPIRSVIITKIEDSNKLIKILKNYGAKTHVFDIILKKDL
ncbi:hypothetical protein J4457_02285 [Candidatus Woesearchaeota archaeon]|nr:hypothetical protein [Candidatus Woesearchaeota archaeon]